MNSNTPFYSNKFYDGNAYLCCACININNDNYEYKL